MPTGDSASIGSRAPDGGAPAPRRPEARCYAAGLQPRDARRRAFWLRGAALAGALLAAGCGEQKAAAPPAGADPERGRQVYQAYCTSCHSPDPAQDGPVGPAVKGASRELLDARVVQGTYPPGYRPKRPSTIMQPLPQLAPEIPNLAAFLR